MFLPSIKLVAYAVIALFFMLSALFIILVIHKIYANRSQASIEQLKRKIQPPIFQNLFGEAEDSLKYFKKKRLFDDAILELLKEMNNQFDLNLNYSPLAVFSGFCSPGCSQPDFT
ncbi:hypothetical protein [Sporolactobacillus terrae]|uniref:hypothetical protein n=1 Tax=Sporolactobacillus terrae TaxID=269673 RepID=UPI00048FE9E7|nr:hypothetical protein [Sporolactobacillus terrae]